MKILSCGAGMQSTALALMACENKMRNEMLHPLVPIYDYICKNDEISQDCGIMCYLTLNDLGEKNDT